MAVGAVEEMGDKGADFVAEGGFCGGEGWLGDEFVVLLKSFVQFFNLVFFHFLQGKGGPLVARLKSTYANGLEDGA